MKRQDKRPDDERLRELFRELRRDDEREAPAFRSLRWIRQGFEPRPTRVRRLAVAGSLAVVVTVVLAAMVVRPRLASLKPPQADRPSASLVTVTEYAPPQPRDEVRTIAPPAEQAHADDPAPTPAAESVVSPPVEEPIAALPVPPGETGPETKEETWRRQVAIKVVDAMDQSPLPGATVVLTNLAPNHEQSVFQTDINGIAELPVTQPGQRHSLQVVLPGYASVRFAVHPVEAKDQTVVVRLRDEIAMAEMVVAARDVAGLEMRSRLTTFSNEPISNPPIQGRFYTRVLTLAPGLQDTDMDGKPNVHGARERDFATLVGGVSNVDPLSGLQLSNLSADHERMSTESYAAIEDNPFHVVADEPLSTFSADVDTASYSNVRRFLRSGRRPPRDAVRIEELINYFSYDAAAPRGNDPFGVAVEVADCPWNPDHRLARITLAARRATRGDYGGSNLVFLLDVSGSMGPPNKLPLVKQALSMLADQLDGRDTVSIVVYAGASGLVLPPTPGSDRTAILESLSRLDAGGSTAGADGLRLAYRTARENFIEGGVNRVILATDGDFNVGVTGHSELLSIIEKDAKRGVFLTALGFGMGNYQDERLEQLADRGNGNYAYIDDLAEARKVLVEEIGGTLVTVAKDVKLQVEFNPKEVGAYRLIGYENRLLAHRDFNDDTKDAGEIGAGHTVTVLYEIAPPGEAGTQPEVDPLLYQGEIAPTKAAGSGELFTLKIRFKPPRRSKSKLRTYPVRDDGLTLGSASDDFRFAAAVAAFGMQLRDAESVRDLGWNEIEGLAAGAGGVDEHGHRAAFLDLIRQAEGVAR